jgi:hypothetical protein
MERLVNAAPIAPARRDGSLASGGSVKAPRTRWPAARELANKATAYRLVRFTGRGPRPADSDAWEDLVASILRRDPFSALFRLERLGHDLAVAAWRRGGPPHALFAGPRAAALPERSLILLHGGMGLAFGDRLIGALGSRATEADLAAALSRFVELCRANARPGWAEPALEALGIIVRLFRPRWRTSTDRLLAAIDPVARACYWHGAGRALYFLPRHSAPGSAGRAVAACRREAPVAVRADALDGFFFAAAMVNLRHPRVLEEIVAAAGERPDEEEAVAGGVTACVLARRKTTPDDPAIPALLAHRPDRRNAALWERRVRGPAERGLALYFPWLEATGLLPSLARHRHLPALMVHAAPPEDYR